MRGRRIAIVSAAAAVIVCAIGSQPSKAQNAGADWPMDSRDFAGTSDQHSKRRDAGDLDNAARIQGRNDKQYAAVVATDQLVVFGLP